MQNYVLLLRNLLAFVLGIVAGGALNMALITVSPMLIAPPAGVDVSNTESLRAGIQLFESRHFIMPFIAHAAGTLMGAVVAFLLAASYQKQLAYGVGLVFLAGGIAASMLIPAPSWFIAVDLILAYLPMAWCGGRWAGRIRQHCVSARE